MNKRIFVVLILAFIFIGGCGKKGQDCKMLENASPETSAMSLYYFDGDSTTIKWLYDSKEEQKIIDAINALKTQTISVERVSEMSVPSYGLAISDKEGYEIWLTYSDGLWLLKDGSVYGAEYDFKSLFDSITGGDVSTQNGGIYMPNSAILGQYDVRYYAETGDMTSSRDGISLSVVSVDGNIVTIQIENDSVEEYTYGTYYSLQKEIDGKWYAIPAALSNYGFEDIAYILEAGKTAEEKCDLTMYGELQEGHYRIEKDQLAAEFYLE